MAEQNLVGLVDRAIELAPAKTVNVEGFTYIDKNKDVLMFKPPMADDLDVISLDGLVDLIELNFLDWDKHKPEGVLIHVVNEGLVRFQTKNADMHGRRQTFVKAIRPVPTNAFAFNSFHEQEKFIIALMSQFVESPELTEVLAEVGTMATASEVKGEDDGFSQRVVAAVGVVKKEERTLKPRVKLAPFRTFLEAEQPASDFILRVKPGNLCALFEADGGFWKQRAIDSVKTWLENRLKGSTVAGVPDIKVVS